VFDDHLSRWGLVPDGAPIATPSGRLLPVRRGGEPAMLKLALDGEERRGGALLEWWGGDGRRAGAGPGRDGALLMERATGAASLSIMARDGARRRGVPHHLRRRRAAARPQAEAAPGIGAPAALVPGPGARRRGAW
jgi:streptomycin 6-kinase